MLSKRWCQRQPGGSVFHLACNSVHFVLRMWPYFLAAEVEGCCPKSLQKFGTDGCWFFHLSCNNCEFWGRGIICPIGARTCYWCCFLLGFFALCSRSPSIRKLRPWLYELWAYGWQYDCDKRLAACLGYIVGCMKLEIWLTVWVGPMVGCLINWMDGCMVGAWLIVRQVTWLTDVWSNILFNHRNG